MESILDVQRAIYNNNGKKRRAGPPMLPHGDDPQAVLPPSLPPNKRRRRRRRRSQNRTGEERRDARHPPPPRVETILPSKNKNCHRVDDDLLFPASLLPAGFPSHLAYRALAAYSLLRTLSIPLRLSPFAPTAFLRALYLPVPNRLTGQVHVAILRVLLRNLKMGYHWGEHHHQHQQQNQQQHINNKKSSTTNSHSHSSSSSSHTTTNHPSVDVVKKRKVDGLHWPLRAGDNLQILDSFTWPVFFDDYCHLSADFLYASMHDESLYIDYDTIDISKITVSDYQENNSNNYNNENNESSSSLSSLLLFSQKASSPPVAKPQHSVIYLQESEKIQESDEEWVADSTNMEEDDDDDEFVPNGYGTSKESRKTSYAKKTGMPPQNKMHHSEILSSSRVNVPPATVKKVSKPDSQFSNILPASGGGGQALSRILPYPSSVSASSTTTTTTTSSQLQPLLPAAPRGAFQNHLASSNTNNSTLPPPPSTTTTTTVVSAAKDSRFGLLTSHQYPLVPTTTTTTTPHTKHIALNNIALSLHAASNNNSMLPVADEPIATTYNMMRSNSSSSSNSNSLPESIAQQQKQQQQQQPAETKAPVMKIGAIRLDTSRAPNQIPVASFLEPTFPAATTRTTIAGTNALQAPHGLTVSEPSVRSASHTVDNTSVPLLTRQVLPWPESSLTLSHMTGATTTTATTTSSSNIVSTNHHPPPPQPVTTSQPTVGPVLSTTGSGGVSLAAATAQGTTCPQTTPACVETRPILSAAKPSSSSSSSREDIDTGGTRTGNSATLASHHTHAPIVVPTAGVSAETGTTVNSAGGAFQAPLLSQTNCHHHHRSQEISQDVRITPDYPNGSDFCQESRSKLIATKSLKDASKVSRADDDGPSKNNGGEKEDAATILRAFLRGGQSLSHPGKAVDGIESRENEHDTTLSTSDNNNDDDEDEEEDLSQWPQFQALKSMRTGIPYHHLNLEEKLDILEFLIDELLAVDEIAAELTKRRSRTSYARLPFARLPSSSDYESMENEDWCSVCRKEGELLCCDGCVASYHRKCVGLSLTGNLPEGQWYCPECILVDPALFGPLLGGRKPCIEWASVNILDRCSRYETSNSIVGIGVESPNAAGTVDDCGDLQEETTTDSVPQEGEYLCVHGYVFQRNLQEHAHMPLVPLLPDDLERHLSAIGPAISSSWPLAQIPMNQSELRDILALRSSAGYRYTRLDHFNPVLYENRYATAPLPSIMGRCNDTLGYESRCSSVFPHRLSDCLRVDMSNDAIISKSLRTNFDLFNPYHMFSKYLLDLESKLSRASLLNETWGAHRANSQATIWRKSVKLCRSSDGIARLMVSLVDAVHLRVFDENWFACTRAKSTCHIENAEVVHLSGNVDLDLFCRTKLWRSCPISSLPSLLSRENSSVADWISECRPDIAPLSRRYKRKRKMDAASENRHGARENETFDPSIIEESSENRAVSSSDGEEVTQARKKLRRFRYPHSITDIGAKDADTFERSQKMKDVVEATTGPFMPEVRWPIAGRKLFPPVGSLPSRVARRIGRKGGASIIPFLSYVPGFEVGQAAVCHVWRQSVLSCRNFEELLVCMRILESHLDQSTIRKCTTLTQRYNAGKQWPNSRILCSEIDLRNGLEHYLVQKSKHATATWVPSTEVELGPLVARQLERYKAPHCTRAKPSYFPRTKQKTRVETEKSNGGDSYGMNTVSVSLSKLPVSRATGMAPSGDSSRSLAPSSYSVAPTTQQPSISHFLGTSNNAGVQSNSFLDAQANHVERKAFATADFGTPNQTLAFPHASSMLPVLGYESINKTSLTMPSNQGLSAGTPVPSNIRVPVDAGLPSQQMAYPRANTGSTNQSFAHTPVHQTFVNATQSMSQSLSQFSTDGGLPSSFAHGHVGAMPDLGGTTGPLVSTLQSSGGGRSSLDNTYSLWQSLIGHGTMGSVLDSSTEPRGYSSTESLQTAFPGCHLHSINGQVLSLSSQNDSLEHGFAGIPPTNGSQSQFLPSLPSSQWFGLLPQQNGMDNAQTTSFQYGHEMSYASRQDFQFSPQGYSQSFHQPQRYNQSQQQPHGSYQYNQSQRNQQMGQYQQFHGTGYGANSYFN